MCPLTCGSCPADGVIATPSECQDTRSNCLNDARVGFCILDSMRTECPKSCGFCADGETATPSECQDTRSDCPSMAEVGFCTLDPDSMRIECPKACGFCGAGRSSAVEPCEDKGIECVILSETPFWPVIAMTDCADENSDFAKKCKKTCGYCSLIPSEGKIFAV